MNCLNRWTSWLAVVSFCALNAEPARAGIPVIDASNLVEAVQNVMQSVTQIENQITQIQATRSQLASISGVRGFANFANSPALHDYIPTDAVGILEEIDRFGTAGMSSRGLQLRNQSRIYDCVNLEDAAQRARCQALLDRPYQQKALLQDALRVSSQRMAQINALMLRSAGASDEKETLEANGRIAGETAMLLHENTQAQLVAAQSANEEQIVRSLANEMMLQRSTRTGQLADRFTF